MYKYNHHFFKGYDEGILYFILFITIYKIFIYVYVVIKLNEHF